MLTLRLALLKLMVRLPGADVWGAFLPGPSCGNGCRDGDVLGLRVSGRSASPDRVGLALDEELRAAAVGAFEVRGERAGAVFSEAVVRGDADESLTGGAAEDFDDRLDPDDAARNDGMLGISVAVVVEELEAVARELHDLEGAVAVRGRVLQVLEELDVGEDDESS